jgi:hypothetical protein
MPPSFTDSQLDALMRAAAPLSPRLRKPFLEDVALNGREIGPGLFASRRCRRAAPLLGPPLIHLGKYE